MDVSKLQFFNNNGYNLNFDWNGRQGYWEGTIYLPKVSVGLYANTTIYILEETPNNDDTFSTEFSFPSGSGKLTFYWDPLNKFVDEFFMFDFDDTYVLKETSALVYTPNDGPDCNTLIINRFDTYDVELDNVPSPKALPVHVAFRANENHDASTYTRTLIMSYGNETIAKIKFYAETVEEDERLKIWNSNLGYNITPEDTIIFYKSDIKEYMPDYILLNEKRKELMLEGSNIYPYIGSYKAIINAIKFFGYDNLNIIEYWRNVNPDDENFGKIYHSSRYSLKKKETLRIGARNIILPNKDYKKINALALVYDINKPTGEIDEWELPLVKEQFSYTIEEALIKLFALRKKLNKEFMPGSSRIIDIIGEGNYFGIQSIYKIGDFSDIDTTPSDWKIDFDVLPNKYTHITDNEYFNRYINIKKNSGQENVSLNHQMISDIFNDQISNYTNEEHQYLSDPKTTMESLDPVELCKYYLSFYEDAYINYRMYKDIADNDAYPYENEEYEYYENDRERFSAKVVLKCKDFDEITFNTSDLKFDCKSYTFDEDNHKFDWDNPMEQTLEGLKEYDDSTNKHYTFDNIDNVYNISEINWTIKMSEPDNQYDDDLKQAGIIKQYESKPFLLTWSDTDNNKQFLLQLPYLGYYDVTMEINGQKKTKKKFIKVEPYNIEILGFFYDIRRLPKNMDYYLDPDSLMYKFIQDNIEKMYGWAVSERTHFTYPDDMSVPLYDAFGNMTNTGPYYNENVDDEWYLADNLTYEMSELTPLVKYTKYIRNGVDVKPYTWFLLGYEYSKIAGKVNPHWEIINNNTGNRKKFDGKYLTLLLKKEGKYTVNLTLEDRLGNVYKISRNIIVVKKSARYDIYKPFKDDYDYYTSTLQEMEYLFPDEGEGDDTEKTITVYADSEIPSDSTQINYTVKSSEDFTVKLEGNGISQTYQGIGSDDDYSGYFTIPANNTLQDITYRITAYLKNDPTVSKTITITQKGITQKYVQDLIDEGYARVVPGPHGNYIEILETNPYPAEIIIDLWEVAFNEKKLTEGIDNVIVWTQLPSAINPADIRAAYDGKSFNFTPRGGLFWQPMGDSTSNDVFEVTLNGATWIACDYPWGSYQSEGLFAPRYTNDPAKEIYYTSNFRHTPMKVKVNLNNFTSVSQVMFTQMRTTKELTINIVPGQFFGCHDVVGMFEADVELETLNIIGDFKWEHIRTCLYMFDGCQKLKAIPYNTDFNRTHPYNELYPRYDGTRGTANVARIFNNCKELTSFGPIFNMRAISRNGCTYDGYQQDATTSTIFDCPKLTDIWIKGLGHNSWNFTDDSTGTYIPNISADSINYLLQNVQNVSNCTLTLPSANRSQVLSGYVELAQSRGWTINWV